MDSQVQATHECPICQQEFQSAHGLNTHIGKKHRKRRRSEGAQGQRVATSTCDDEDGEEEHLPAALSFAAAAAAAGAADVPASIAEELDEDDSSSDCTPAEMSDDESVGGIAHAGDEDSDDDGAGGVIGANVIAVQPAVLPLQPLGVNAATCPVESGLFAIPLPPAADAELVDNWTTLAAGSVYITHTTLAGAKAMDEVLRHPNFKVADLKSPEQCIRACKRQKQRDVPDLEVQRTPVTFGLPPGSAPPTSAWNNTNLIHHKLVSVFASALADKSISHIDSLRLFDYARAEAARATLASPVGPGGEHVDEPMETRANLEMMLERVDLFKALGYAAEDIVILPYGAQWDAISPDHGGAHSIDQFVVVRSADFVVRFI
jgi:hypothetical protein